MTTEQNPTIPPAPPVAPAPAPTVIVEQVSDKPTRYAAYDNRYQRFVGPVFDRKPSKAALTALLKGDASTTDDYDDLEIREV